MSSRNRKTALAALNAEVRGWQIDQEMFDATIAELAGLNRTDWRCLDHLTARGPMTAGQLAAAAHLTTGAVTVVVDHLEAAGLARRVRDGVDRRRVIIEATDEVARRAAPVYGPLMKDNDETLRDFGPDELELIAEFIRRQRALLTRHTGRARQMLLERDAAPDALPAQLRRTRAD